MENITIFEYIKYVSYRPEMYLRKNDYEELINHISYFISFKKIFNLILQNDLIFINQFPEWICQKYGYTSDRKHSWDILLKDNNSEPMKAFFQEVELFRQIYCSL